MSQLTWLLCQSHLYLFEKAAYKKSKKHLDLRLVRGNNLLRKPQPLSIIGERGFRSHSSEISQPIRSLKLRRPPRSPNFARTGLRVGCLVVNSRAGHRPDDRPAWKCPRGRPQTWIRQLEIDVGLTADAAWDMAGDRDVWRAHRRKMTD